MRASTLPTEGACPASAAIDLRALGQCRLPVAVRLAVSFKFETELLTRIRLTDPPDPNPQPLRRL